MVINSDMNVLPTTVKRAAATSIRTDRDAGEASQLLNIEVEQIAGSSVLIADQGHGRLQIAHATQMQAAENAAHGGPAQPRGLGNVVSGGER